MTYVHGDKSSDERKKIYNLPQELGPLLYYSPCSVSEVVEVGGNG